MKLAGFIVIQTDGIGKKYRIAPPDIIVRMDIKIYVIVVILNK